MRRLITLLASFAIVAGLAACCCPCGPMIGGGNNRPPNQIVFNPPVINVPQPDGNINKPNDGKNKPGDGNVGQPKKDPAVAAIEARKGGVTRENNDPNGPVVEVNLTFTRMNDNDLKGLAPTLAAFPQLRKLKVSQNRSLDRGDGQPGITGTAFRDLTALQRLEELDVSSCDISDEGMKQIVATCKKLKVLNIMNNNKIFDAGIKEVAKLGQLEELDASGLLNGPQLSEPIDSAIKELGKAKQLRKLDLSNTSVGDLSMAEFAKLPQLQALTVGSRVTNAGVDELAGHPSLQKLTFITNSSITAACVPTLKNMPALQEVVFFTSGKAGTIIRNGLVGTTIKVTVK